VSPLASIMSISLGFIGYCSLLKSIEKFSIEVDVKGRLWGCRENWKLLEQLSFGGIYHYGLGGCGREGSPGNNEIGFDGSVVVERLGGSGGNLPVIGDNGYCVF
jgi:hypothetical protein